MKKLVLAFMMGAAAMAANAQVNYKVQTACHPQDVKHYDTELLRSRFIIIRNNVHNTGIPEPIHFNE